MISYHFEAKILGAYGKSKDGVLDASMTTLEEAAEFIRKVKEEECNTFSFGIVADNRKDAFILIELMKNIETLRRLRGN